MIKILQTALLLLPFLGVFSAEQKSDHKSIEEISNKISTEVTYDWETYENEDFSFKCPKDWDLDQSGQMGTTFILFSPIESAEDIFKENINLMIQDLSSYNLDLDGYMELTETQIKTLITNSKLIESKRIKTDNDEYHRIIYNGDQGIYKLRFEQYIWIKGKTAYVLTLASEQEKGINYERIGQEILKTFKLK